MQRDPHRQGRHPHPQDQKGRRAKRGKIAFSPPPRNRTHLHTPSAAGWEQSMTETSRDWLHDSRESGLLVGVICALGLFIIFWYALYLIATPLCVILPPVLSYRYARPVKYSGRWEAILSGVKSGLIPVIPMVTMILISTLILGATVPGNDGLFCLMLGLPLTVEVFICGCLGGLVKALALPSEQLSPEAAPPSIDGK